MTRTARAFVSASTAAIALTLISRFHNPISYQIAAPGRYALRGLYAVVGLQAERLGLGGLIAFSLVANVLGWFVVLFLIARIWREDRLGRTPVTSTVCFLILRAIAVVFAALALAFVVYMFVVPDRRHGNMWAMLMAAFCFATATIPALAAFVLLRMMRT